MGQKDADEHIITPPPAPGSLAKRRGPGAFPEGGPRRRRGSCAVGLSLTTQQPSIPSQIITEEDQDEETGDTSSGTLPGLSEFLSKVRNASPMEKRPHEPPTRTMELGRRRQSVSFALNDPPPTQGSSKPSAPDVELIDLDGFGGMFDHEGTSFYLRIGTLSRYLLETLFFYDHLSTMSMTAF